MTTNTILSVNKPTYKEMELGECEIELNTFCLLLWLVLLLLNNFTKLCLNEAKTGSLNPCRLLDLAFLFRGILFFATIITMWKLREPTWKTINNSSFCWLHNNHILNVFSRKSQHVINTTNTSTIVLNLKWQIPIVVVFWIL